MADIETDPNYHDPDDALRLLIERHHLIVEMQQTPGWALWRDYLAAEAGGYQRRLLYGQHKEMLDYQRDAGVLHGIRIALDADQRLAQRVSALRDSLTEHQPPDDQGGLATEETDT